MSCSPDLLRQLWLGEVMPAAVFPRYLVRQLRS